MQFCTHPPRTRVVQSAPLSCKLATYKLETLDDRMITRLLSSFLQHQLLMRLVQRKDKSIVSEQGALTKFTRGA